MSTVPTENIIVNRGICPQTECDNRLTTQAEGIEKLLLIALLIFRDNIFKCVQRQGEPMFSSNQSKYFYIFRITNVSKIFLM